MTKPLFGRVVLAVHLALVLLLSPAIAAQQQGDSAYEWLNGKWRGPAPGGGLILIDVKASAAGDITGNGRMVSVSRSTYEPQVSGKVDGDKVTLVLSNPKWVTTRTSSSHERATGFQASARAKPSYLRKLNSLNLSTARSCVTV